MTVGIVVSYRILRNSITENSFNTMARVFALNTLILDNPGCEMISQGKSPYLILGVLFRAYYLLPSKRPPKVPYQEERGTV